MMERVRVRRVRILVLRFSLEWDVRVIRKDLQIRWIFKHGESKVHDDKHEIAMNRIMNEPVYCMNIEGCCHLCPLLPKDPSLCKTCSVWIFVKDRKGAAQISKNEESDAFNPD
jgi:hypothetical protein